MDMEGMDLEKLSEMLGQMQSMIDEIKAMMPSDATSAAEEESEIDESTAQEEAEGEDEESMKPADDKAMKRMAIMRMMSKE